MKNLFRNAGIVAFGGVALIGAGVMMLPRPASDKNLEILHYVDLKEISSTQLDECANTVAKNFDLLGIVVTNLASSKPSFAQVFTNTREPQGLRSTIADSEPKKGLRIVVSGHTYSIDIYDGSIMAHNDSMIYPMLAPYIRGRSDPMFDGGKSDAVLEANRDVNAAIQKCLADKLSGPV